MIHDVSISSSRLFLSSAFRVFMEDTTNSITRRFRKNKVEISIVNTGPEETASTNGSKIRINFGFYCLQKLKTNYEMFRFIRGFNGHELGHVLFDDFVILKKIQLIWKTKSIYPLSNHLNILTDEERTIYEEIKNYIDNPRFNRYSLKIYLELNNILNDAFVNMQMKEIKEFHKEIEFVKNTIKNIDMSSYQDLMYSDLSDIDKVLTLIHRCSVYNMMYDDYRNPLVKKVIEVVPLIDKIKNTKYGDTRMTYIQIIFLSLWEYLKPLLDGIKEADKNSDNDGSEGQTTPGNETGELEDDSSGTSRKCDDKNPTIGIKDIYTVMPNLNSAPSYDEADKEECSVIEKIKISSLDEILPEEKSSENNMVILKALAKYGILMYDENNEVQDYGENGIEYNNEDRMLEDLSSLNNFQKVLETVNREEIYKQNMMKEREELLEFNKTIIYSNIHTGLDVFISRIINVDMSVKAACDIYMANEITPIVDRMVEEITRLPFERRNGGRQCGYYSGKRISLPAVIRKEKKIFERFKAKLDMPSITIQLIVDESGSMNNDNRIGNVKRAALILNEAANRLSIPIGIIGHKADCDTPSFNNRARNVDVLLNIYTDYKKDVNDKYRIMTMNASGCNRDGYALMFGCKRLLIQNSDIKICILLTDGRPNADKNCYTGKLAKADLVQMKKMYEERGITLLVAAIGDDKELIKDIYGNCFVDIKEPEDIPEYFCSVLKDVYQ